MFLQETANVGNGTKVRYRRGHWFWPPPREITTLRGDNLVLLAGNVNLAPIRPSRQTRELSNRIKFYLELSGSQAFVNSPQKIAILCVPGCMAADCHFAVTCFMWKLDCGNSLESHNGRLVRSLIGRGMAFGEAKPAAL